MRQRRSEIIRRVPFLLVAAFMGVTLLAVGSSRGEAFPAVSMVVDINPGPDSGNPGPFTIFQGAAFFAASDGTHGGELWRTDGTAAGTSIVSDINPSTTPGQSSSSPRLLTVAGNQLFFRAHAGATDDELWVTDGTDAGTRQVRPEEPNGVDPRFLTGSGGILYFNAEQQGVGRELWRSDGSAEGTYMLKDIASTGSGSNPNGLVDANGQLFFVALTPESGNELWRSDGTPEGTRLVRDIHPSDSAFTSFPATLFAFGDTVYFAAKDGSTGPELWKSDGTSEGTVLVKDIFPGEEGSFPHGFVAYNGAVYFVATDGVRGSELWRTDGTTAGTQLVTELKPGVGGPNINDLTVSGGLLYFSAEQSSAQGEQLWRSDGTAAGTWEVTSYTPGDLQPRNLVDVQGTLFFTGNIGELDGLGKELMSSDGTAAGTVIYDLLPGSGPSFPSFLTALGGRLLFVASSSDDVGFELWAAEAGANAPPPPFTAYGSDLAAGDEVRAFIGAAECASTAARSDGYWVLYVPVDASCGPTPGATVSFTLNGQLALETETWVAGGVPDNVHQGITLTPAPAPQGPSVLSVGPNAGTFASGTPISFSVSFADANADISVAGLWLTPDGGLSNDCFAIWTEGAFFLVNDAGSSLLPASGGTAANSQCELDASASSAAVDGTQLDVTFSITPLAGAAGQQFLVPYASDSGGRVAIGIEGEIEVTVPSSAPEAHGVSPNSGSVEPGVPTSFIASYTDSDGATDIAWAALWFTADGGPSGDCFVLWVDGQLLLVNDAASGFISAGTVGSGTTASNGQCTVDAALSSQTLSGSELTLTVVVTFDSSFSGPRYVVPYLADAAGQQDAEVLGPIQIN